MSRVLYIAARPGGADEGRWGPVGRLDSQNGEYRFVYTRGAQTLPGFQPFPGMPDLDEIYRSDELFPLFANRLLSPSRPEYRDHLRWGAFDPDDPPAPLAVLGVTGGLRQTDSLEVFPCPVPDENGRYVAKFFVHGLRWMHPAAQQAIEELTPGAPLRILLEHANTADPHAVQLQTAGRLNRISLGYVPRYLARDIRELCQRCDPSALSIAIERVNHRAPLQQRLLCRLVSCWPENFKPCGGDDFQPIVDLDDPSWLDHARWSRPCPQCPGG